MINIKNKLILIATPEELKLVDELGFKGYPVLITGVGGMNVIKSTTCIAKDTEIINIGYCGSNSLPIGKKVNISLSKTYHETADFYELPTEFFGQDDGVVCYTSTDFVTHTDIKEPCVFDMELAFICSLFENVRAIKKVSDNLSLNEYEKNCL